MKVHAKIDVEVLLERIKAEGPDAPISRAEATALIASRTMDAGDTVRTARNRVGTQLSRAVGLARAGRDIFTGGISPLTDGSFTADELGRWANGKYDNKFSDMPRKPRDCNTSCCENIGARVGARTTFLPGDRARAHEMILQLLAEKQAAEAMAFQAIEERNRALGKRFTQTGK